MSTKDGGLEKNGSKLTTPIKEGNLSSLPGRILPLGGNGLVPGNIKKVPILMKKGSNILMIFLKTSTHHQRSSKPLEEENGSESVKSKNIWVKTL